jgi:organic radical activating enzyme
MIDFMKFKSVDDMAIVSVDNAWKDDVFKIDINLGNYCNYKCWYCWPGSNEGTQKFPDLDLIKTNISHLITYMRDHGNKKVFDIHFCGGEPSHWPKLLEFVKYLKEEFNCLISMTSNGSKKMSWWKEAAKYFDRVHLSCHREFVDLKHFRDVADFLYKEKVVSSASVMMDPREWDQCMEIVDYLKQSKYSWTIRYVEIIDSSIKYTEEQINILKKHRARRSNPIQFWLRNKYLINKISVVDEDGKRHRIQDNELLLKKRNNFYGWECTVGVHWVNISMHGWIGGTCNQTPYGEEEKFNLYDPEFPNKFKPNLVASICSKTSCVCSPEVTMPKKKLHTENKKVIPIYAN